MENSTNNSWGWFVDIEAPLYKTTIHTQYLNKATLPTISEVPRNKLTEIYDFEDEFEEENSNSKNPSSWSIICYIAIIVIIYILL
jgi:hypothetical protein